MKCYSKTQVTKHIKGSGGLISTVAKRLGCSYNTAVKYIKQYQLETLIEEEKEAMLDMAEGKLMQNIMNNDNASIFFYLKTQGKKRGYVERSELTGQNGAGLLGSITSVSLEDVTEEEEQLLLKVARQIEHF